MTRRQREDAKQGEAKPSRDASKSNRTGHNWADRARQRQCKTPHTHTPTHIQQLTHTHTGKRSATWATTLQAAKRMGLLPFELQLLAVQMQQYTERKTYSELFNML